ncbi:MAG: DUF899 family protein [Acidobacteriia bacterium]|nr:DUF899 family protein [Terriglobia bacterium]
MKGPLANESEAYRRARAELLEAEIALRDQCERVAALRRMLPVETDVDDYVFEEGPRELDKDGPFTKVRLSGLFADVNKPLVVYQYMYGGAQKRPCPMCTLWIDGFNGVVHHLRQRVNFAVIAQVAIGELREWGRQRGWHDLRLVSSAGSNFKRDLQYQDAEGSQHPGISVFVRSPDGSVKHFYSNSATMKEQINRGIDLLSPVWNTLDLTPEGRGDWNAKLNYE